MRILPSPLQVAARAHGSKRRCVRSVLAERDRQLDLGRFEARAIGATEPLHHAAGSLVADRAIRLRAHLGDLALLNGELERDRPGGRATPGRALAAAVE